MRVVLSFSTIPSRVQYLSNIIDCLQKQTYPVDQIYLNLPYTSRREQKLYPPLPNLNLSNVKVVRCADYGPITKLYPVLTLEKDPSTIIITVDDDVQYNLNRVETLVKWCLKYPNAAIGGGGFIVGNWYNFFGNIISPKDITSVSVIEGNSACAYRRGFFNNDLIDYTGAPSASFYHDDVWISGYLAKKGILRMIHPEPFGTFQDLPNGLSNDRLKCVLRFFPVLRYFQNQGLFQEIQVAYPQHILGYRIIAIILLVLAILFIIIFAVIPPQYTKNVHYLFGFS